MVSEEYKKIAEFCENDNRNLSRILVINKDDEYEERYGFGDFEVLASDKQILAISDKNYDCIIDCCDNCMYECYNEETDEYYCEENQDKTFCAVENQLAYDYDEWLWDVQRRESYE